MSNEGWYCENCGKHGGSDFLTKKQGYCFCSDECRSEFGAKLWRFAPANPLVSSGCPQIHCPYCGTRQRFLVGTRPRICTTCAGNMDELPEVRLP